MPERYTVNPLKIDRVALLGVGLIGGSIGLSWKRYRPDLRITGFDTDEVLGAAKNRGAIDAAAVSAVEAVADADLVVLAVPLSRMCPLLDEIAGHLKRGAWVTDVGSVKGAILAHAEESLPEGISFVGGHPMAGAERGGIEYADALLFENATYVLCPPRNLLPSRLQADGAALLELIRATGARVLLLDAARHDRIAAAVSHLPQLIAIGLVTYASTLNEQDDAFLRLAAGGFRDITRIASSPFDLWRDILVANEGPVLDALAGFAATFQRVRNRLIEGDQHAMEDLFDRARAVRDTIPKNSKGFLHPLADVYVYAEDRPGILLEITRTLFAIDLNIKDIELLKIREGTGGAFRMSFSDPPEAEAAIQALQHAGFTAYRL